MNLFVSALSKEIMHGSKKEPTPPSEDSKPTLPGTPTDAETSVLSTKDYTIDEAFFQEMYK